MADTETKANVGVTIFLFLVAASIIAFSVREQVRSSAKPAINPVDFPDYTALAGLKKLTLVENIESWTPDANVAEDRSRQIRIRREGTLSRGYIYVRASIDGTAFTKWESIYVKVDDAGGHLFRSRSLPVPAGTSTELLYALDDIPYLPSVPYSETRTPDIADWFAVMKGREDVGLYTFVSSLRPAKIEEMALYYDCIGDGSCSLSIIEE